MNAKDKLIAITALNSAVADLQAAKKPLDKISASARLIALLQNMGLYDQKIAGDDDVVAEEDKYSDNPNDDNYRYADTGYIAGAHKELAGNRIKDLAKDGLTVKATDIDWSEIEADALFAESIIKKSNIIGTVDYQALKDKEMQAGTAYIIQKVFAAIAAEPHWDIMTFLKNSNSGRRLLRGNMSTKQLIAEHYDAISIADQKALARKAYVNGINTLKSRLTVDNNIKSATDLADELKAIGRELGGYRVNAAEEGEYKWLLQKVEKQKEVIKNRSAEFVAEYKEVEARVMKDMQIDQQDPKQGSNFVEYLKGEF